MSASCTGDAVARHARSGCHVPQWSYIAASLWRAYGTIPLGPTDHTDQIFIVTALRACLQWVGSPGEPAEAITRPTTGTPLAYHCLWRDYGTIPLRPTDNTPKFVSSQKNARQKPVKDDGERCVYTVLRCARRKILVGNLQQCT